MQAIVDLESHLDTDMGDAVCRSVEAVIGNAERVGIHDDLSILKDADRVFVTGSADMLSDVEWATRVAQAIEAAARHGVPVLAVCFGHQMMARHFGATIGSFPEVQKGLHDIRFATTGPFQGLDELIHTHRDHVLTPGEMMPAGGGGFGGIAALRHPALPIWTCQGHPEWNAEICRLDDAPEWKRIDEKRLDMAGVDILERFAAMQPGPGPA